MKQPLYNAFLLFATTLLLPGLVAAQNFDETWKEFLENNKISNMSALVRPDKRFDQANYAKYLLMNTNTDFCQSDVSEAETLLKEIRGLNENVLASIPGYVKKLEELELKVQAFHRMDALWEKFLQTGEINIEQMKAIPMGNTVCEKGTLAKYSYMLAYDKLCAAEVDIARNILTNRTLRLAEKTSWKFSSVKGMEPRVTAMDRLFKGMTKLDEAWDSYLDSGESPGFELTLPVIGCYTIPNQKEKVLKGVADLCEAGPKMVASIEELQASSAHEPDYHLENKIEELQELVGAQEGKLAALNAAWESFLPDNEVDQQGTYGYEYCSKEPLIRAYIMDGFTYVCELAQSNLEKIDSLQRRRPVKLDQATKDKIKELEGLTETYAANGEEIERIWDFFVINGDTLLEDYESATQYCDHIQEVKDWTMRAFASDCDRANEYLQQIEEFNETFEFKFYEDLECRIQRLRLRVWQCKANVLREIAALEAEEGQIEERFAEVMQEYNMPPRPEDCTEEGQE